MAFEVVDANKRDILSIAYCLCERAPYKQGTDEAGPVADGNCSNIRKGDACLLQCLFDNRHDHLDMPSRCEFRHDATVRRVDVDLGGDHRAAQPPAVLQDGGGRLVARRFDAKDQMHRSGAAVRPSGGTAVQGTKAPPNRSTAALANRGLLLATRLRLHLCRRAVLLQDARRLQDLHGALELDVLLGLRNVPASDLDSLAFLIADPLLAR